VSGAHPLIDHPPTNHLTALDGAILPRTPPGASRHQRRRAMVTSDHPSPRPRVFPPNAGLIVHVKVELR
jgi:hypothetical protein